MAYLGRGLDKISNIEVLDNITFDGSSSYSITKGSVAFTPNSAQSCLISIDGVVQATNFTVSSSTIDFGVAIPSTSVCNFFLHYGTGVMTVPSDGSVTESKIGSNAVTSAKLGSDVTQGITNAQQFRITADLVGTNNDQAITTNIEEVDSTSYSGIGSIVSQSSGIFSFSATGLYYIIFEGNFTGNGTVDAVSGYIQSTINNSTYNDLARANTYNDYDSFFIASTFVNVDDITNVKVKFRVQGMKSTSHLFGATNITETGFNFIRLGDSQ